MAIQKAKKEVTRLIKEELIRLVSCIMYLVELIFLSFTVLLNKNKVIIINYEGMNIKSKLVYMKALPCCINCLGRLKLLLLQRPSFISYWK